MTAPDLDIFLVSAPGLESVLCAEARELRFRAAKTISGGVTVRGDWSEVWRANLALRGPVRVLARIASFRAEQFSELDKRSRKVAWGTVLRQDRSFRVEASCTKSRLYHSSAVAERIARAIREEFGAPEKDEADVIVKARLERDVCTIAVDTSGEPLHKRGHKPAVAKAPMRENLAALFLRQCSYTGDEPVVDPMCGSGTFVIEAAEIAAGLMPGRSRQFAFEALATFNGDAWKAMKAAGTTVIPAHRFHGSDRDAGAIRMARENAGRAGVGAWCDFEQRDIADLQPPAGPPGLVIVNPPYGGRIGERPRLHRLYRTLGDVLTARFSGWRVGLVTSEAALAKATGLPFGPPRAPVLHGGIRVMLSQTAPLP
ncbi:MAG: THUMP domain-containing protein [Hyphomicrobiaceae bacterium]